jgi:hypothetical protein
MPIHDWTRVDAGIFHHFHHGWIEEIARALNRGLLPPDHYALAEQIAGGLGPDVLTLHVPGNGTPRNGSTRGKDQAQGGVALATVAPRVRFHSKKEPDLYAAKAKSVVIRHTSDHDVVAVVEIVSPGNKGSRHSLKAFVDKAGELLRAGIHLLVIDLFPTSPRDPHGLHPLIWESEEGFAFSPDKPLTLAAYTGAPGWEAFIEPVAVNDPLPEMPLYLTAQGHVPVPLEATYQSAWDAVPAFWRETLSGQTSS